MMARLGSHALACCVLVALATAVLAQDRVYRCGPDGREYSSTPCPGGKTVDVSDPRTAEQRRAAANAAAREAELGDQLARERRQREQAAAGQPAAGIVASQDKSKGAENKPVKKRMPKPAQKIAKPDDPNLSPKFGTPAGAAPKQP